MTATCEHSAQEHAITLKLARATWVLALTTLALILATLLLTWVTAKEKAAHEPAQHATEEVQRDR